MFVEDPAPFFADFGTDCVVAGVSVRGIFDAMAQQAFGFVSGTNPQLLCAVDVPGAARGSAVRIGSADFLVAEADRSAGLLLLSLEAA